MKSMDEKLMCWHLVEAIHWLARWLQTETVQHWYNSIFSIINL